jgi:hypothetical protein
MTRIVFVGGATLVVHGTVENVRDAIAAAVATDRPCLRLLVPGSEDSRTVYHQHVAYLEAVPEDSDTLRVS